MNWRGLWFGLVVCVSAGTAVAQRTPLLPPIDPGAHRDLGDLSLTGSLQSPLEVILGSLDALYPDPTGTAEKTSLNRREDSAYSSLTVGMADNWRSGLAYMFLSSPTRSFPVRENAGVRVSYDDSGLWSTSLPSFTGLQPSATVGFETNEYRRGATDAGIYLQLGITPGYELRLPGDHPVVASMPVTLGIGSDYGDFARSSGSGFGYLDVGLAVSTPLSLLTEHFGSWGVTASVNFLFLGEGQEALNGGDDFEVIGSITFGFDF